MKTKVLIVVVLALLLAGAPAFADEVLGELTRFRYDPAGNQHHLLNPSAFQLAQASPGAGNQKSSSAPAEPDMAEIAKKANNPLSDVWLLINQNDTSLMRGDLVKGTKVRNSFKIQPVMPIPVFKQKWNLIFRPIIPIVSSPFDTDGGRTSGMGDTVLLTLLGPNRDDGWIWGAGMSHIFPTANKKSAVLGQEKWQVGPSALLVRLGKEHGGLGIENWNFGILPQQFFSYAGTSRRPSTNQMDIQYFINWKLNATQLIGMTPNIGIDWTADSGQKVSFPIGLGTIGMFKIGRLPIRWGVEVQYYVVRPDDVAPEWNFKFFFAPIILNPFK